MPFTIKAVTRPNISIEVQAELRRRIVHGELAAGQRLNEVELANRLHISRTPLREALSLLIGEGLVQQRPRRGFFVSELTIQEAKEIYPIRQLLDPAALELSGLPEQEVLSGLFKLNEQIKEETDTRKIIQLDDRWHLDLLSRCPNQVLLQLIKQFMERTHRYEMAYMSDGHNVRVATQMHEQILMHLEHKNLDDACEALRQNMTDAEAPLLTWLASKERP